MVFINKLPMSITKGTQGVGRPCVRLIQMVLDPEVGVAQILKPAHGASRGGIERRKSRCTNGSQAKTPEVMRELEGGSMPSKGVEIPMLPMLARTFNKDFFRDRTIEVIHAHSLCL